MISTTFGRGWVTRAILGMAGVIMGPAVAVGAVQGNGGAQLRAVPETRAERTRFAETSRYADVQAFVDSMVRLHSSLVPFSMGKTVEGRNLLAIVAARPRVKTPAEARALGRPVVYLNAGIHAGEVEGKEAVLALLRDLAADPRPNVLDSVVIVAIPAYNTDGGERLGPQAKHRRQQNGPELVGVRANAQEFDLNRDYIKAEAPETRAFLATWNAWKPDVYVDLHTTNGSYHGYALTYSPALTPNADPYTRDSMLPALRAKMRERHRYEAFDYGNFDSEDETRALTDTVKSGWYSFDGRPRFGITYAGLRGRIGILSEAYSHDPFDRRVAVTRAFVEEILSFTAAHRTRILAHSRRGDRALAAGSSVAVRAKLTPTPYTGPVVAEDLVATGDSSLTEPGVPRSIRRTGRFRTLQLPIYDRFVSALDRTVPLAYLLLAGDTAITQRLSLHGIRWDTLGRAKAMTVESFVVDSTWAAPMLFQGHRPRSVIGRWLRDTMTVPAGTVLVPADQPATALLVYLLEPESDDGFVTWNVLDRWLVAGQPFPIRRMVR